MGVVGEIESVQRLLWTARRKPLESFLLPQALAGGRLACRNSSLVSLLRLDGVSKRFGGVRARKSSETEQPHKLIKFYRFFPIATSGFSVNGVLA